MLNGRRRRWNMAATFVAAYLLVLQSAFGAFALGLGSDAGRLDGFGNVICTHEGTAERPTDAPLQKHMPACCILGCTMVSPLLGTPPDAGGLHIGSFFRAVAFPFQAPAYVAFARDYSPSNPRAPPIVG